MSVKIKFCYRELKERILPLIFNLVQFLIATILIIDSLNVFTSYVYVNKQISDISKKGDIYAIEVTYLDALNEYCYENENYKYIDPYKIYMDKIFNSGLEQIVCNNLYSDYINGKQVEKLKVNSNFFKLYNLTGDFDNKVIDKYFGETYDEFFKSEYSTKNAIVGYNYSKDNKIGDIISSEHYSYRIVGFLSKNSFFSLPTEADRTVSLDDAIIVNSNTDLNSIDSIIERITNTLFIVKDADDLNKLEEIVSNKEKLDIVEFNTRSMSSQMIYEKDTMKQVVLLEGFLGLALFTFSIISFIFSIIQLIEEKEYEYAINMLCGAKKSDIYIRIIFTYAFIILAAFVCVLLIASYNEVIWILSIVLLLTLVSINIYAYKRINKRSIYEKLRRNE